MNTRQFKPCVNCKSKFEKVCKENDCLRERVEKDELYYSSQKAKINDLECEIHLKNSIIESQLDDISKLEAIISDLRSKNSAHERNYATLEQEHELVKVEISNIKTFPCAFCDKLFRRGDNLKRHQISCQNSKRKNSILISVDPNKLSKKAKVRREEAAHLRSGTVLIPDKIVI